MKFQVEAKTFANLIAKVEKCAGSGKVNPIYAGVKLSVGDNVVTAETNNLEQGMIASCPAIVTRPGEIAVPAAKLLSVLSKAVGDVSISDDDKISSSINLRYPGGKFQLSGWPGAEFPSVDLAIKDSKCMVFQAESLVDAVRKTRPFVSTRDNSRYSLASIAFDFADGKLRMMSSDTHRASDVTVVGTGNLTKKTLAPVEFVDLLASIFTYGEVQLHATDYAICARRGEIAIHSRLVEGSYPDMSSLLKKWLKGRRDKISSTELRAIVDRVAVIKGDAADGAATVKFSEGRVLITLQGQSVNGEVEADLPGVTSHKCRLDIGNLAAYLKVAPDEVEFVRTTEEQPIVFCSENFIHAIMPMY